MGATSDAVCHSQKKRKGSKFKCFDLSSYQHIITGSKRTRPLDDSGGGILADDMGLGKSLTTLSIVVGSLDIAKAYAESNIVQAPMSDSQVRPKMVAKSTLISVPSACKLLYLTYVSRSRS